MGECEKHVSRTHSDEDPRTRSRNMHEDVPDWKDTCSCEPEPRWQRLEDEGGEDAEERDRAEDRENA